MSDVRSGPSLWTYLMLLMQPGILPYFPNSLLIAYKANLNNSLEEVHSFKLLGLTTSDDLSWAYHIFKVGLQI